MRLRDSVNRGEGAPARRHGRGAFAAVVRARLAVGAALILIALAASCDRPEAREVIDTPAAVAAAAAEVPRARPGYAVREVADGGRITGWVIAAHAPRDTVVQVDSDQARCGRTRRMPLVERRGTRVTDAVVWLEGVARGKPMPLVRRYVLESFRCAYRPRVQAAAAGGTLNVRSRDPLELRTRFTMDGRVLDVVEETDAGQVVPTGKVLADSGLVQVLSQTHSWSRAWIRVFDHPYFAATTRDGTFRIDSIPPGTYRLVVWQPALGVRDTTVTVSAKAERVVHVAY